MTACIVGWAHTPFGRLEGETVESLIVRVATEALSDAGVAPGDVDEIMLGHFNAGFSAQDFTASLVLQASPDLRFKRATRVENACATGSAAVHQGLNAIAAKRARIVLVVGVEQMTTTPAAEIGKNLLKASYVREEADIDGRASPASSARSPRSIFSATATSRTPRAHRGQEPPERRRQPLRADAPRPRPRLCRRESEEPVHRRPASAQDCRSPPTGRPPWCLRTTRRRTPWARPSSRSGACAGFPADVEARHPRFEGCAVWRHALTESGLRLTICHRWSRRMTASPLPN